MTTDKSERIGIIRGLDPTDESLIAEIVRRLGAQAFFNDYHPEQVATSSKESYRMVGSIDDIRSLGDFVLREHFDEFQDRYYPKVARHTVGRAFNYLVDTRSSKQLLKARIWDEEADKYVDRGQPLSYDGLSVKHREELGFRPYYSDIALSARSIELATFAIETGSLVDAAPNIAQDFISEGARLFTLALIDRLAGQVLIR